MPTGSFNVEETGAVRLRSLLFVPGDSEKKLAKAVHIEADVLIVDLEDSVAPERRDTARELTFQFLRTHNRSIWVRINPLESEDANEDLESIMPALPAGIVLPKCGSGADVVELSMRMDPMERRVGERTGRTKILPIATELPEALFNLQSYIGCSSRLAGITWGAEDLSAAIGASRTRYADHAWTHPFQLARSLSLMTAKASGVLAIDTVYQDFRDMDGLRRCAEAARLDGFDGMLAIHPNQVPIINAAFTPTDKEIERARRIVDAFEANGNTGVIAFEGRMLDAPHLKYARRVLAFSHR